MISFPIGGMKMKTNTNAQGIALIKNQVNRLPLRFVNLKGISEIYPAIGSLKAFQIP